MVKSVVILCEDSPIGKNSAVEAIRMGAGITAVGDLDECKIIFMGDSVYFLSKNFDPEKVNREAPSNILRLMELSDIEIYALDSALEIAGIKDADLIEYENIKVASMQDISKFILEADVTYRY
ncbi:MAG: DsrE family protein [Candidatus Lokiarchaeota archaeon]|nr:DsrE family protein [Candidatus Lokiarchaeota archaeon]